MSRIVIKNPNETQKIHNLTHLNSNKGCPSSPQSQPVYFLGGILHYCWHNPQLSNTLLRFQNKRTQRIITSPMRMKKEAQLHANSLLSFCSPVGCCAVAAVDKAATRWCGVWASQSMQWLNSISSSSIAVCRGHLFVVWYWTRNLRGGRLAHFSACGIEHW